ncbi:MAG TPA: helix-turn-helix domain-containing protein [Elusimicrobiota bacterium]|jgi:DNA-binding HxlR family transcriptional regulator|nr:helix-turn-helix domain-containing protein [Elusimicrobiota bacterium]
MNDESTPDTRAAYLTLELLRGRWKLYILRRLNDGPQRTGQLLRALQGIAKNRLNQNLRELERTGILRRKSFKGRVQRVEYVLTERGRSLRPVIESLHEWGAGKRALLERLLLERKSKAARSPR